MLSPRASVRLSASAALNSKQTEILRDRAGGKDQAEEAEKGKYFFHLASSFAKSFWENSCVVLEHDFWEIQIV